MYPHPWIPDFHAFSCLWMCMWLSLSLFGNALRFTLLSPEKKHEEAVRVAFAKARQLDSILPTERPLLKRFFRDNAEFRKKLSSLQCIIGMRYSGWNPPPGARRVKGDLFYLEAQTLEGKVCVVRMCTCVCVRLCFPCVEEWHCVSVSVISYCVVRERERECVCVCVWRGRGGGLLWCLVCVCACVCVYM
jgi:hypothetical protein